jgi:hypothetical protein
MDWRCVSSIRATALQTGSPGFKLFPTKITTTTTTTKKKKQEGRKEGKLLRRPLNSFKRNGKKRVIIKLTDSK